MLSEALPPLAQSEMEGQPRNRPDSVFAGQLPQTGAVADCTDHGRRPTRGPSSATTEMRIARLRTKLGTAGGAAPCIKALHCFGY